MLGVLQEKRHRPASDKFASLKGESVKLSASKEVRRTMKAKSKPLTIADLHAEFWTGCPHCDHDEAEGGLVNHCDDCCRRITTVVGDFLRQQGKKERRVR